MLRTQLNNEYFQDLMDKSGDFGVNVEGHRAVMLVNPNWQYLTFISRY
jgi:hypothetical protein